MKHASHVIVTQLDQNDRSVILMDNAHVNQVFMVQNVTNASLDILDSQKLDAGIDVL